MFKKQAIVALVSGSALALTALTIAPSVHAAALTSDQVTAVVNLLQSFGVDQSTIGNVQSVLNGTAPATNPGAGPATGSLTGQVSAPQGTSTTPPPLPPQGRAVGRGCAPGLTMNLRMGSRGDDVSNLQAFLGEDATGVFGTSTREAVRQWQVEHGILATGTPALNFIGPKTRSMMVREMERRCHEKGRDNGGDRGRGKGPGGPGPMMGSTTPQAATN